MANAEPLEWDRTKYTGAEWVALRRARQQGSPFTFIDKDGCEVTVTPDGHIFFNATDWF